MNIFKKYNLGFLQQTIFILFCIFISILIGQVISIFIVKTFNPQLLSNMDNISIDDVYNINLLKTIQTVSAIFTFIVPSLLIGFLFSDNIYNFLSLNKSPKILYYVLSIAFMFSILPFMNLVIMWNSSIELPASMYNIEQSIIEMEESSARITKLMLTGSGSINLIISVFVMAIVPAIGEELMFRGVIQKHLISWTKKPHISIIISAIIFSAVHFQFYGFFPRFILGAFFGYLAYYSGSLFPAIFVHFFNNLMAVISYKIGEETIGNTKIEELGTSNSDLYLVIIGIIIAVFIGRFLFTRNTFHN